MKCITVNASKEYNVLVGSGLLQNLAELLPCDRSGASAMIVSDSHVWPIYGEIASKSLENKGFSVHHFVFEAGESKKTPSTYLQLLNHLAEKSITRSDYIIALGGGVVGDLAGFAASTYLRGITYIQIPTTLLSMVDSSVGGKTAIDLPAGKNLVGTFYQPSLVLCDTDTLLTLPDQIFIDGCAEVIKYGILYDPEMFSQLEQEGLSFCREDIIAKCIAWKAKTVHEDEFDTGVRQLLNLGHTIGHSIEKASNYCICHGQAVSIGIRMISKIAVALDMCDKNTYQRINDILLQFKLPTVTDFSASVLASNALSDKKRDHDEITLILPATIGCCVAKKFPINQLESLIKEGM